MANDSSSSAAEFQPTSQAELSRYLGENASHDRTPIVPVGGRTALNYGYPTPAESTYVSLTKLTGVVDYPSRDMNITVETGIRMNELANILQEEGQQLPIDVSQSNRATLGGVLATNTSGPRRFGHGTMRDYVIGIKAINARGKVFHGGGRVVKNVAGYDLCKLLVGSLGTLAVVTQVTLKVKPVTDVMTFLCVSVSDWQAADFVLNELQESETRPTILELFGQNATRMIAAESRIDLPNHQPLLLLGIDGGEREVNWQIETLKSELENSRSSSRLEMEIITADSAVQLLTAITEFPASSDDPLTFRASVPPSRVVEFLQMAIEREIAVGAHAGNGIITGHFPDSVSNVSDAAAIIHPLRDFAEQQGGRLVVCNCDAEWKQEIPVFGNDFKSASLMKTLKSTMDPEDLLNPGRLFRPEKVATD
ncbi:MAG: FAD-binding oxidoreductase [Planctomycetaceae bacterium]